MRGTAMLTPRIRTLGTALREARIDARFGLRELSRRIGTNPALVSNWELGQRIPALEDVAGILGALGIVGQEKQRILQLARGTAEPGWVARGKQSDPDHLGGLLACERAATSVVEWQPLVLPGLLQIPDYARALFLGDGLPLKDAERQAEIRMMRRPLVVGPGAVPCEVLLGETALRNPVGGPSTMARQLRFLADLMATSAKLTVRVVPSYRGGHPGLAGRFCVYYVDIGDPIVYFEHQHAGAFLLDEGVDTYRGIADRIRALSLDSRASATFVQNTAQYFREIAQGNEPDEPRITFD
ncbi:helix-turn-helix domain-containing protein [Amycolatopsis silviterrae]|uniref:Helix-turn-helix domain-containing protein n=1 Tax=Amycolatopsis silviterrae TaxID=1656914 RepID=A0ABW5H596_9PSEU